MDIRNKHPGIRQFALKATASTILALNAEAVFATACPAEIYGNTLAGIICTFDSVNSNTSVTVENGGTVAGILTASNPPAGSFIMVNAGGVVSNTTGAGITISSSSLSNGITNNAVYMTKIDFVFPAKAGIHS
jgi:hypothetical protein